tara:strand:- start:808 stop:999 length:192 start_codon:yes stop_codon:yes gene_type:complete
MNKISLQISDVNNRLEVLQERSYRPELSVSELKEINKRKKKLQKTKSKLVKKLSDYKQNNSTK